MGTKKRDYREWELSVITNIVESVGMERVIAYIGAKRVIKRIGVDRLVASLSPAELKKLKERLTDK